MHKKNRGMIIAFVTPALLFFVATFVYPIIRTTMMSFFVIDNVTASMNQWKFTGISNYVKLLNTPMFGTACLNLLKIWLYGGIIVMTLALLFAVILSSGIKQKIQLVLYMPNFISVIVLCGIVRILLSPTGMVNMLLTTAMSTPKTAYMAIAETTIRIMALI